MHLSPFVHKGQYIRNARQYEIFQVDLIEILVKLNMKINFPTYSKPSNKKKSFLSFEPAKMYCLFPDVTNAFHMNIWLLSNSKNNKRDNTYMYWPFFQICMNYFIRNNESITVENSIAQVFIQGYWYLILRFSIWF